MLKPSVQIHNENGIVIAEFWDCWRLDPAPVQELRAQMKPISAMAAGPKW